MSGIHHKLLIKRMFQWSSVEEEQTVKFSLSQIMSRLQWMDWRTHQPPCKSHDILPGSISFISVVIVSFEEHNRGISPDIKLLSHLVEPGAVDTCHANVRVPQRLSHVLPHGLQLLAVSAPGSVELHQPHSLLVDGQELVRDLQHLARAHALQNHHQQPGEEEGLEMHFDFD